MTRLLEPGTPRVILLATGAGIGLTVLYGGLIALILWLCGSDLAGKIGLVVGGATAGLCVLLAVIGLLLARRDFNVGMNIPELLAVGLATVIFVILLLPLLVLTAGRIIRWLEGSGTEEPANEEIPLD